MTDSQQPKDLGDAFGPGSTFQASPSTAIPIAIAAVDRFECAVRDYGEGNLSEEHLEVARDALYEAIEDCARDQARSATTEGRGPKDAEPGAACGTRPKESAGEALSDADILACLVSVDSETKRLPPGFLRFARAVERAALATQAPAPSVQELEPDNYFAQRLERSLEDFPDAEHVTLHRDFLRGCAQALRQAPSHPASPPAAPLAQKPVAHITVEPRNGVTRFTIDPPEWLLQFMEGRHPLYTSPPPVEPQAAQPAREELVQRLMGLADGYSVCAIDYERQPSAHAKPYRLRMDDARTALETALREALGAPQQKDSNG